MKFLFLNVNLYSSSYTINLTVFAHGGEGPRVSSQFDTNMYITYGTI